MSIFLHFFLSSLILMLLVLLFYSVSYNFKEDSYLTSSFECGYTSFKTFSLGSNIPFLIIALIFLLLDLELCFLMIFFNEELFSWNSFMVLCSFILFLLLGLILEWKENQLNWLN